MNALAVVVAIIGVGMIYVLIRGLRRIEEAVWGISYTMDPPEEECQREACTAEASRPVIEFVCDRCDRLLDEMRFTKSGEVCDDCLEVEADR